MSTSSEQGNSSHLSVRPDGTGPREALFQFEVQKKRMSGAAMVSLVIHLTLFALIFVWKFLPEDMQKAVLPERIEHVIFLPTPGPAGGGGGASTPAPPKPAEIPKPKPPTPIPDVPPPPTVEPPPDPTPPAPVQTVAATQPSPGVVTENATGTSAGPGVGPGSGGGRGTGIGQGGGSGFGDAFGIGNGVTSPIALREAKPAYTAEAMRARIQGVVLLQCVVMPDGTVGSVQVVKSLDSTFGLDQEAIKAAKLWRFRPGTRLGEPVPVIITIELTFTLR